MSLLPLMEESITPLRDDKGPTILIAMWTTTTIAAAFVAGRVYTRFNILKAPGLDDFLIAMSLVSLAYSLTSYLADYDIGNRLCLHQHYNSFCSSWKWKAH